MDGFYGMRTDLRSVGYMQYKCQYLIVFLMQYSYSNNVGFIGPCLDVCY